MQQTQQHGFSADERMQSSNTVADAAVLPTSSNVVVAPADASSTPTVATATVAQVQPLLPHNQLTRPILGIRADGTSLRAGLIIGEPTGASLKYWLTIWLPWTAHLGGRRTIIPLCICTATVLWHKFDLFDVPQGNCRSISCRRTGPISRRWKNDNVGIRVPVGVSYMSTTCRWMSLRKSACS